MIEVVSSTEIDASPATVWRILVDLEQFHTWNPFIREASGTARVGGKVWVRVRTSLGIPLRFSAEVLDADRDEELHWRGHVLSPWLASGEHWFAIEPVSPGRVRFVQRERFSGILPRLGARLLAREAGRGFVEMNAALKQRAEAARARAEAAS